jgi:hypothetical protein
MFNYLVETKNEYTTHLCNIISPFIYEGFSKMYSDIAFPKSLPPNKELNKDEILCFFQKCLKQCKNWNTILIGHQTIIENETSRILLETSKQGYPYLEDLIKASLKANLSILMFNPSCTEQLHIDSNYYENKIHKFFYILYIEFAKELWCNPYLMYHNYSPIDIKRNQRECIALIKECIKETIKKILPIKQILCNYLREETIPKQENKIKMPLIELEDKSDLVGNIEKILQNNNLITTNTEQNQNINSKHDPNILNNKHDPSTINNKHDPSTINNKHDPSKINNKHDTSTINNNDTSTINNKDYNNDDNDNDNDDDDNDTDDDNNDNFSLTSIKIAKPCNDNNSHADNSHEDKIKKIIKDLNKNEENEKSDTSIISNNYKEIFGNSK